MTRKRNKSITLSKDIWLRNSSDIKAYRKDALLKQGNLCAISKTPLEVGCLDHSHLLGFTRGVIQNEINLLEGKYLKLFNKMKINQKYKLTFGDFLCNMGNYLNEDYSNNLLHYMFMSDTRKKLKYLKKEVLLLKLKNDYNIRAAPSSSKEELVHLYMTAWVDEKETQYDHKTQTKCKKV